MTNALANRGIPLGSEAYDEALGRLDRTEDRALENLALSSVGAGRGEHSRLFGLGLAGRWQLFDEGGRLHDEALRRRREARAAQAQRHGQRLDARRHLFGEGGQLFREGLARRQQALGEREQAFNQRLAGRGQLFNEGTRLFGQTMDARRQLLNEMLTARTQPLNELSALLQGAPAVGQPQFPSYAHYDVQAPDYMGMVQNNHAIRAQNAARARSDMVGGLFNLGSALISLSDQRLKTGIRRVGTLDNGLPVYAFRYRGDAAVRIGLMADEVERTRPEAVAEIGGVRAVDYGLTVGA